LILEKLQRDTACRQLHFYNWTEPLIHPRIAEYCRAASGAGFHVHLSSNLNVLRDPDALLAAGIKTIRVSLSGFTQPVYERGHRGGRIERVKENMRRLSDARRATGSATRIHVYYHKYRYNLHEVAPIRALAKALGFDVIVTWAYLMPLENVLGCIEGELDPRDLAFADASIVPSVASAIEIAQPHRARRCELIDQLVLDFQGNAILCCAVYDHAATTIGRYLDLDWPEIQARRYGHRVCDRCMHYGVHVLGTYFGVPELVQAMERRADEEMAAGPPAPTGVQVALPVLAAASGSDHPRAGG
jgi:hypothetical protein